MIHFFSRRAFDTKTGTFTANPAVKTRYVRNETAPGGAGHGSIIDRDTWLAEVVAAAATPDILIHVHGYNIEHAEMLARHRTVAAGLKAQGFDGAVVSFDWPSDGSALRYNRDRSDAKTVAEFCVTDGIFALQQAAPNHRIHVLAHSMGAYLTLRGFSGIGGNWRVGQVLFVAADVDRDWMRKGAWGALVMDKHCTRLTNYFNIHDEVLNLSRGFVNGGRDRAGLSGLPASIPASHCDLYCAEQFETKVADKSDFNSHRWFFEDQGFYRDAALTLAGQAADAMPTRQPTDTGGLALLT